MEKTTWIDKLLIIGFIAMLVLLSSCSLHHAKGYIGKPISLHLECPQHIESLKVDPVQPQKSDKKVEEVYGIEIGNKVKLDLEQSIQQNEYYCGPSAVEMLLKYFHVIKTQDELAKELHTVKETGTEYKDVASVLNTYIFQGEPQGEEDGGYRVQTLALHDYDIQKQQVFEARLKRNIEEGYPSILAINLQKLYYEQNIENHFVVCVGYISKYNSDEIAYFYILDPYYGVQDAVYGGLKVFTPQELYQAIVDNEEPAYIW